MKLAAYDLEIAKELPEDVTDWTEHRPLGISCAALGWRDPQDNLPRVYFWKAGPAEAMNQEQCAGMVRDLVRLVESGYTLVTWNGLAFDFDVLAEESGLHEECAMLARNHVDLMFVVVAIRGHRLGLDAACKGMRVAGKLKEVTLSDGAVLEEMNGALAPELWKKGETQAVLDYLGDDVRSTLELAEAVAEKKALRWTSQRGRLIQFRVPELYTVEQCLELPEPDTSWMTDPPTRASMLAWAEKAPV